MTEYSKEVREKAAAYANELLDYRLDWTATTIVAATFGSALCQAVQDGALHLDPVELDKARWEEACKVASGIQNASDCWRAKMNAYRALVRTGWTPPEPVDPVEQVAKEVAERHNRENMLVSLNDVAADAIRLWIERNGQ